MVFVYCGAGERRTRVLKDLRSCSREEATQKVEDRHHLKRRFSAFRREECGLSTAILRYGFPLRPHPSPYTIEARLIVSTTFRQYLISFGFA